MNELLLSFYLIFIIIYFRTVLFKKNKLLFTLEKKITGK